MDKAQYTALHTARRIINNMNAPRSARTSAYDVSIKATAQDLSTVRKSLDMAEDTFSGWANANRANEFKQRRLDLLNEQYEAVKGDPVAKRNFHAWTHNLLYPDA